MKTTVGRNGAEVCVIFNPKARGEKARHLRGFLEHVATEAELKPTTGPRTAQALAREAVLAGHRRIIAAGGDGTAFEVLNGIAEIPDGLARVALGIMPMGTANVLAHELGMPTDAARAWQALKQATVRKIDCCVAEFHDASGAPQRAFFVIVAGAGLDARAVELVNWNWKRRVGKLAYIAAAFRALTQYPDRVRYSLDGQRLVGRAVLAGNGRQYAGEISVFEDGALDSGRLHVCGIERITLGVLVRSLGAYLTGRWRMDRYCVRGAVSELRMESEGQRRVPLQLDGEFAGWLPATLRVLPGALQVLGPWGSQK